MKRGMYDNVPQGMEKRLRKRKDRRHIQTLKKVLFSWVDGVLFWGRTVLVHFTSAYGLRR